MSFFTVSNCPWLFFFVHWMSVTILTCVLTVMNQVPPQAICAGGSHSCQRAARGNSGMHLHNTQDNHTTGNILEVSEIQMPLYSGTTAWSPWH